MITKSPNLLGGGGGASADPNANKGRTTQTLKKTKGSINKLTTQASGCGHCHFSLGVWEEGRRFIQGSASVG